MRYAPAILLGRVARTLARLRKPGGGSAVPGLVVNTIAPGFLPRTLNGFPGGLVIVTGSAGKSTTTKMLVAALRASGVSVFTNQSTANISQGLTSALLERVSLTGRIEGDIAVLEMDEGHGALISGKLNPRVVVLTNVMVDQIDRFHDSDMVAAMLAKIALRATGSVVLNADDLYLARLGEGIAHGVTVNRYGVSDEVLAANPRGLGYTLTAPTRLDAADGMVLTRVSGLDATVLVDGRVHELRLPARGTHYAVDAITALAAARAALQFVWWTLAPRYVMGGSSTKKETAVGSMGVSELSELFPTSFCKVVPLNFVLPSASNPPHSHVPRSADRGGPVFAF